MIDIDFKKAWNKTDFSPKELIQSKCFYRVYDLNDDAFFKTKEGADVCASEWLRIAAENVEHDREKYEELYAERYASGIRPNLDYGDIIIEKITLDDDFCIDDDFDEKNGVLFTYDGKQEEIDFIMGCDAFLI